MKNSKLFFIMSLLCMVVSCNMQSDDFNSNDLSSKDITIVNGKIQSPNWLVQKVNDIADRYNRNPDTGERIYSSIVSLVKHKGKEYIHIDDVLSSHSIYGNLYFTISGIPIEPDSNLYAELSQEKNRKVLWYPWGN
jgi:hypothetical protein